MTLYYSLLADFGLEREKEVASFEAGADAAD